MIVDETADLDVAAKKVVSIKFINCGQNFIAPDYILVHELVKEAFIEKVINLIRKLYIKGYSDNEPGKKKSSSGISENREQAKTVPGNSSEDYKA